jgi:hypothetical protein
VVLRGTDTLAYRGVSIPPYVFISAWLEWILGLEEALVRAKPLSAAWQPLWRLFSGAECGFFGLPGSDRGGSQSLLIGPPDLFVNLGTVDRHSPRGFDPKLHLVAIDCDDDNANIVTNHN